MTATADQASTDDLNDPLGYYTPEDDNPVDPATQCTRSMLLAWETDTAGNVARATYGPCRKPLPCPAHMREFRVFPRGELGRRIVQAPILTHPEDSPAGDPPAAGDASPAAASPRSGGGTGTSEPPAGDPPPLNLFRHAGAALAWIIRTIHELADEVLTVSVGHKEISLHWVGHRGPTIHLAEQAADRLGLEYAWATDYDDGMRTHRYEGKTADGLIRIEVIGWEGHRPAGEVSS